MIAKTAKCELSIYPLSLNKYKQIYIVLNGDVQTEVVQSVNVDFCFKKFIFCRS